MTNLFKLSSLIAMVAIFGATSVYGHCGSCGTAAPHKIVKKMSIPDVDHDTLKTAITAGEVFLIDVNGSNSYKKGHIPGAVDFASLGKEGLAKVLPENKGAFIVAYCGGPQCGAYKAAVKAAVALGYTDVHHYSEGISGWKHSGEELESAEG